MKIGRSTSVALILWGFVVIAQSTVAWGATDTERPSGRVWYRSVEIDGLEILYREAGSMDAPTILLLHGFPTSSHMFRNLMPAPPAH